MVELTQDNGTISFTYKTTGEFVHISDRTEWESMDEFIQDYHSPNRKEVLPKLDHFTKFMNSNTSDNNQQLTPSERLKKIASLIEESGYNANRKTILQIHQLATKP